MAEATEPGCPPCEPNPVVGQFDFDVMIEAQGAGTNFHWYRLQTNVFVPLQASERIPVVNSSNLLIPQLKMSDVGVYARLEGMQVSVAPGKVPCDVQYSLLGTTNVSGTFTLWGAPMPYGGTVNASWCGGVGCPGTYASYVSYSAGWFPAGAPGSTQARDGNSVTSGSSKVRYYCSPFPLPGPTPPTCGCGGSVTVLNPNPAKRYTFTIYFPPGVAPSQPHPITLVNFIQ